MSASKRRVANQSQHDGDDYDGQETADDLILAGYAAQTSTPAQEDPRTKRDLDQVFQADDTWRAGRSRQRTDQPSIERNYRSISIHRPQRPLLKADGWNDASLAKNELDSIWRANIKSLSMSFSNPDRRVENLQLDDRAAAWVDAFIPVESIEKMWMNSALWLLANDPDKTLDFLLATHHEPFPPQICVSQCLQFLTNHYIRQPSPIAAEGCVRIAEALKLLAVRGTRGTPLALRWRVASLLFGHLSADQLTSLYDTVEENNVWVQPNTLISFATVLTNNGEIKRATNALMQAHRNGAMTGDDVNASKKACTLLLRKAINEPDGLEQCLRLCQELGTFGLQPDAQIANVLILNAVDVGEIKTAMGLYEVLFVDKLRPDKYTIATLLKAFRRNPEDAMPLNEIANLAQQHDLLWADRATANDLLNTTVRRAVEKNPGNAWHESWQLFSELYDTKPLERLGLPPPHGFEQRSGSHALQPPSVEAITSMLDAYLKLQRQSSSGTLVLWKQFQALISAEEQPFVKLATTDHCYNMFLYSFVHNRTTLLSATEVIKDMQTPFSASLGLKKCRPTDISWNIFLLGFRIHRMEALAEQVLQHMQSEGIKPSQVAWEQLAGGYTDSQDLEGLLSALRRADQSGAVWTEWMEDAVGRFKDKDKLREALMEEQSSQLDFTSDLKDGLFAKLQLLDGSDKSKHERPEEAHARWKDSFIDK